jgi:hypothetical protein
MAIGAISCYGLGAGFAKPDPRAFMIAKVPYRLLIALINPFS